MLVLDQGRTMEGMFRLICFFCVVVAISRVSADKRSKHCQEHSDCGFKEKCLPPGNCKNDKCQKKCQTCQCNKEAQCEVDSQNNIVCNCTLGDLPRQYGEYCTDECEEHTCGKNGECKIGSCHCKEGFSSFQGKCKDINECIEEKHKCDADHECRNTCGSYVCEISPYKLLIEYYQLHPSYTDMYTKRERMRALSAKNQRRILGQQT